ncbi:MAG TPA: TMEM165/GDT1 family protein [Acidimicrobiales bacterium]|nr:TMEM165/GDT1 family protein [Acidimicrobiales bacterium]
MGSLLAALGLVFVAELGDKTQLVALGLGARHRLGPVLAGTVVAYAAANLLSVTIGGLLGAALPTRQIGIGGGVLFLALAVWSLRSGAADGDADADVGSVAEGRPSVFLAVAGAMFVAELGDKTMLATSALAAQGDPVLTWIGATLGIVASGVLAVLVGRALGTRLPERVLRTGSAALFALFGVALIAANL